VHLHLEEPQSKDPKSSPAQPSPAQATPRQEPSASPAGRNISGQLHPPTPGLSEAVRAPACRTLSSGAGCRGEVEAALARHARLHSGVNGSEATGPPLESPGWWPVPGFLECWSREKFGPISVFELNHYYFKSLSDARERRRGRSETSASILHTDKDLKCPSAGRALRFLEVMCEVQSLSWEERVARYHQGSGSNGKFCIPSFSGRETCRPHFLTAGSLRLHDSDGPLQAEYLKEWLDFHTAVGFDHFYVWRMFGMRNDTLAVLQPYLKYGVVTLLHCWAWRLENGTVVQTYGKHNAALRLPERGQCLSDFPTGAEALAGGKDLQRFMFSDAIDIQRPNTSFWTAFFDLDEYFFPSRAATMREVLLPLTNLDPTQPKGFRTNQLNFGTSGWDTSPQRSVIESYLLSGDRRNGNFKSLVLLDAINDEYQGNDRFIPVSPFQSCVLSFWVGPWLICMASQWRLYHGIGTFLRIAFALVFLLCACALLICCTGQEAKRNRSKLATSPEGESCGAA